MNLMTEIFGKISSEAFIEIQNNQLFVLKNFTKFTGNTCAEATFVNKVAGLQPEILLKKRDSGAGVFL